MAVVGVLALQGSYNEHIAALRRIGAKGVEVQRPQQLRGLDSLIIPGGESTTMAKLADYHNLEEVYSKDRVIVAVRQGNILATAFHPELTSDSRWHRLFLGMDKESQAKGFSALLQSASSRDAEDGLKNKPLDLPLF